MQQLIGLLRICAICTMVSIGYVINVKSIIDAILVTQNQLSFQLWSITYVASSTWLFAVCIFMIMMTLFGIKINFLSTRMRKFALSLLFFIGSCGLIASILLPLVFNNKNANYNKYISRQYELIYALIPLYLAILIFFFNNKRFTQTINLILFSLILFIPPCLNVVFTILHNKGAINMKSVDTTIIDLSSFELSAYLAICIATSIAILTHIICMCKHFNSGLFLKLIIISLLAYGIIVLIVKKVGFNVYEDEYRIYYYYVLETALFIIYSCEIFVPGPKKRIQIDITDDILKRPSFNMDIELQTLQTETSKPNNAQIKCLLHRCKKEAPVDAAHSRNVSESSISQSFVKHSNPNELIDSVIKIFPDFKPTQENEDKYFSEFKVQNQYINELDVQSKNKKQSVDRITDSIAAIVPFYNESASEIHATLRALYQNFEFIKKKNAKYKFTHFNVLLVGDGWFKADISTKKYLTQLYPKIFSDNNNLDYFNNFKQENHKHNTVILQTKHNRKLCINPFKNDEKKLYLKVTTIIKIDNRKKANSHEWFLGKYGFAEWCKCDYMFFTDAYSTMNSESLYRMVQHMNDPKNQDVVCCTGRARVYTIEQELDFQSLIRETVTNDHDIEDTKYNDDEEKEEHYKWWDGDIFKKDDEINVDLLGDNKPTPGEEIFYKIQDTEFDHRLTTNAHLRDCQRFEFEALYGTIGSYLLGGFLPVIPGPCGFYRSKYVLKDEVRGWYFQVINKKNDPDDMDLVLGNMKLAEDRILTVTSILNYDKPVRHSLIPECVFYFDPMPNITQLMKQRRRWLNGSIATVLFILRKISFSKWNVNIFRRYYVLSMWYMQLLMYLVVALSAPLLFIISYQYGLKTILYIMVQGDDEKEKTIDIVCTMLVAISWAIYIIFIYFMQRGKDFKWKFIEITRSGIVQMTLIFSFTFGVLIICGMLIQILNIFKPGTVKKEDDIVTWTFNYIVIALSILFFTQSFVLAPLVSKDFQTFKILLNTFGNYLIYSSFYVTFFFMNAIANIHDLSWGTRPDGDDEKDNNPKKTTIKILLIVICLDVIIAVSVSTLSAYKWSHIIFFSVLAFPSLYQIFFALLWLIKTRFGEIWDLCKPKRTKDNVEYVGFHDK